MSFLTKTYLQCDGLRRKGTSAVRCREMIEGEDREFAEKGACNSIWRKLEGNWYCPTCRNIVENTR